MKLAGKVAIVTGSSRGIGKAIALELAREGADVVVAARTEVVRGAIPGTIGETAEAIRALGRNALPVRCNLAEEEDIVRMVERTREVFGRIDILVNNAGLDFNELLVNTATKQWDIVMKINVRAPYLCCREVIPHMASQHRGSIVNISSPAAEKLSFDMNGRGMVHRPSVLYGTSKAALDRLTRGLALELAEHNIAVNALKPLAPVRTEGVSILYAGMDLDDVLVDPGAYMTKAAVFLAAQDASGHTGRVVDDQTLCRESGL